MSIVKIIEVIGTSEKSFDDAARNAVQEASKSVDNIKSIYVKEMNGNVDQGKITSFAVNAKISFTVR